MIDKEVAAKEWVQGLRYVPDSLIALFGIGEGYELKALFERIAIQDKIIVIEKSDEAMKQFCASNPDFAEKHRFYRVRDWNEFKQAFLQIGDWNNFIVCRIPSYPDDSEQKDFVAKINMELNNLQADQATTEYFCRRWQENILKNLKYVLRAGVAAEGIKTYSGPAIVVAAGPSLQKNIHLLSKAKGKALILATQTTNRLFETGDTLPDLVFSFDGGYENYYEHFDGVKLDVPLVFDPTIYWKCVTDWRGRLSAMLVHPAARWLERRLECRMLGFASGPSIACTILDFAYEIGANPIIFIGQDLAFTGGRFHIQGSHRSEIWDAAIPVEKKPVQIEGYYGEPVLTDRSMLTFLHWYEESIRVKYKDATILNCTEGGANIRGMVNMPFADALDKHCVEERDIAGLVSRITIPPKRNENGTKEFLKLCKQTLIELREPIKRATQATVELAYYYANKTHDPDRRAKLISELAEVDELLISKKEVLEPIHYMIRPLLTPLTGGSVGRKEELDTINSTHVIYNGLWEALQYVVPLLEDV